MSAGDNYKGIRSMPNSKNFRDNFEATFGWKCKRCGTTNESKAEACFDCKKPRREFCQYCGAGLGDEFREGEGTCRICDPPNERGDTRGFQGGEYKVLDCICQLTKRNPQCPVHGDGMRLFSADDDPRT